MMEIRHVEIGEQEFLSARHPELAIQRPDLAKAHIATSDLDRLDVDFPYLFYALEDKRVVAHFMSFMDVLISTERQFRWVWNYGLYTEPDYRRRGIAEHMVQRQLEEFARRDLIWGGVFSSPAAIRLYERMKFSLLGHAPRLCLVRNIRPILRHHTQSPTAISVGGLIYGSLFSAAQRLQFSVSHFEENYSVDAIDASSFRALFTRPLVTTGKFYWGNHARWFEVRQSPIDKTYIVRRRGESDPCAFLIIRERTRKTLMMARYTGIKVMSVMEFRQFDRGYDIPNALIGTSLLLFRQSDADLLEFVTSSPTIIAAARRRGFLPLGMGMSFKYMAPPGNPLHGLKTTMADWHLSHYCGDAYGFE